MTIGVILAAGKGTRLNCVDRNKTSLELKGKPLIQYGIDVYSHAVDRTLIVLGAFADSVKACIHGDNLDFAYQTEQLGTGHAAMIAVEKILESDQLPDRVFIGYGDHMMFYTPEIIQQMEALHQEKHAAVTLVSTTYDDPNKLAWGRIIRDETGHVTAIIEQKDATEEQRQIKDSNAGFYCFDFGFLREAVKKLKPSAVTGEYYITDLIAQAVAEHLPVAAYEVPFQLVGTGINTPEQIKISETMMEQ